MPDGKPNCFSEAVSASIFRWKRGKAEPFTDGSTRKK